MELVKTLSILLKSSSEAMIHDTLDYFLRLLYEFLETAPKRRLGACTVFDTFEDVFRRKLLKLLNDVEHSSCGLWRLCWMGGRPILTSWLLSRITRMNG